MSQNLSFGLPLPVVLALAAALVILLALLREVVAWCRPVPVRAPARAAADAGHDETAAGRAPAIR